MTDEHSQHIATSPHEVKGVESKDRPGPQDHGGEGGMATRELAPDLGEGGQEPPD
ncbi:hypothetical protein [Mycobacterium sp. MS1601]|uniref:hypothetical protein n=1 Tax=Mycobacterium sp. MS1601 TaxID=1936029 RepID=UPI0012F8D051|nr:hypothetical protein [Mycobacterium sp. MS1601]